MNPGSFILERDAVMRSYTADVAAYCAPFLAKTATSTSIIPQKTGFGFSKRWISFHKTTRIFDGVEQGLNRV